MPVSKDYVRWLGELTLDRVRAIYADLGARTVLVKELPRNANSKNQIYLASDLSQLGQLPSGEVTELPSISKKTSGRRGPIFRVPVRLAWIQQSGALAIAPEAKLIAYPQFPEVRLSGVLAGCAEAPSHLFAVSPGNPPAHRTLFLGVLPDKTVAALALPPDSPASIEFRRIAEGLEPYGVMRILPIGDRITGFARLAAELCRIHRADWIGAERLTTRGLRPCHGPNCGGYTLEAQLGISANGYAEPDFDGWEVKSRSVASLARASSSVVTLFTPEPTFGVYVDRGPEAFVRQFGYPDVSGRPDRINFGGCYRVGAIPHARTDLTLRLRGFDADRLEMEPGGAVELVDPAGRVAAGWSFVKLLDHWKKKHAQAVYVPCERSKSSVVSYRYGQSVLRATGAQFRRVLVGMALGCVYYDPGIKLENASSPRPQLKRRSQFRIKSTSLDALYEQAEIVDVCTTVRAIVQDHVE